MSANVEVGLLAPAEAERARVPRIRCGLPRTCVDGRGERGYEWLWKGIHGVRGGTRTFCAFLSSLTKGWRDISWQV